MKMRSMQGMTGRVAAGLVMLLVGSGLAEEEIQYRVFKNA